MALEIKEIFRGINLDNSYNRIQNVIVSISKYADKETREKDLLLSTDSISIPVTDVIYKELKKLENFKDAIDC